MTRRSFNITGLPILASHLLVIPLILEGKTIGILLGADKLYRPQISSIDVKLFSALGHSLSFYLQNTMLLEDTHAMFIGTMHALTKLIDAKDSYTYGHTERVALLTKQLASRLGLDAPSIERVYIASLIHDVGKIGIPEAVLCKPGALTEDEFNLIKKHPEIGARVLSDIPQMRDLIPGVLHHHERWDGSGYPHQLAGQNIPLLGRLIALADAYDAMSSNRTYRSAMGHSQVLVEIRRCIGTQFDPELAKMFLELDFEPYSDLIRQHKFESTRNAA